MAMIRYEIFFAPETVEDKRRLRADVRVGLPSRSTFGVNPGR